ncbi:N-formylglutamate amidohydrolase [Loktanella sp. SALINAS62]|uniref:N-formylglutamate amidohydrolase n=1 Tax=Loktanella sp. SALINAS62 TaxID=2706124 RepID=UPI001B8B02D0|nr:N-formylglutamate amidohydrolase [Loktanella sp. SALINAS62]MBS1302401.1 N-formylglutamate amidohydrolase [Loktanella sp. SALINAS62]
MTHDAYQIDGADRPGRWIITCDHATNLVPAWVSGGDLGLPTADMNRHIAYDIGAEGLSRHIAAALDSPMISSRFSRLVIDPNRGEQDPTLLMRLYDGTVIPANRAADAAELTQRLERLHRPYHSAIADLVDQRPDPVYCAIHSFTPKLTGREARPWEVAILYGQDARLAVPLVQACRAAGWVTGDNQPYTGNLPGDSVDRHAIQRGIPNILIEVRHDLIDTPDGQALWAGRLAPILEQVLANSGL